MKLSPSSHDALHGIRHHIMHRSSSNSSGGGSGGNKADASAGDSPSSPKSNGYGYRPRRRSTTSHNSHSQTHSQTHSASVAVSVSATIDAEERRKQDKRVCIIRGVTIATLLIATGLVAGFTGWYVASDEKSNFELQYEDSVAKVAEAFQHRIDTKHEVAKTFSAMITSRYGNVERAAMGMPPIWPNVTIPDFQEQAEGSLSIADGRALSFNPIITQDVNRLQFEQHAAESAHILGLQDNEQYILDPGANRTVAFGIYSRDTEGQIVYDPGYAPESTYPDVMVPVWQIAPIETNEKAVMFNLHWERNRQMALDHMMDRGVPALTAILQLVQDAALRPSSILFYPVFDTFGSYAHYGKGWMEDHDEATGEEEEESDHQHQHVTGSVSIVFSWDTLLNKILPDYIKGMYCILHSSTGQKFSYSISGDTVTLLGEGDLHDPNYEEYGHHVQAKLLLEGEYKFVTYQLHMYPSAEFEAQYVTNRAGIYAAGAVLIFLFTAGLFLLYDYLVEDRQQKTARLARQTGNIVDSMFPAAFRERLFRAHGDGGAARRRSSTGSGSIEGGIAGASEAGKSNVSGRTEGSDKGAARRTSYLPKHLGRTASAITGGSGAGGKAALKQIDRFMKGVRSADTDGTHNPLAPPVDGLDDEPIADLFLDTSIMFSDIVGFTKWSAERSPHEVFRLLEQIFWEFDELAARHNVFKLGTIGDCYIAVTGIPEPIDDHATVLTQFAFEARDRVRNVCNRLEREGLHTASLDMRFGIHSGATTAGILRGTKSRFELFGDTINTASRMESTGVGGKIQVSEETAELIRSDGKNRWLIKRDSPVTAKGKGQLQTYWAEPQRAGLRVSFSEKLSNFLDSSIRSSNSSASNAIEDALYQLDEEEKVEEDEEAPEDIKGEDENDSHKLGHDDSAKTADTVPLSETSEQGADLEAGIALEVNGASKAGLNGDASYLPVGKAKEGNAQEHAIAPQDCLWEGPSY